MKTLYWAVLISMVNALSLFGFAVGLDAWKQKTSSSLAQAVSAPPQQPSATPRIAGNIPSVTSVKRQVTLPTTAPPTQTNAPILPPLTSPVNNAPMASDVPPPTDETAVTPPPTVADIPPTETPLPLRQPADIDARCIITVDGGQYDVTTFRSSHKGGDIFACGADMTQTFYSQHDAGILQKMQRYRI